MQRISLNLKRVHAKRHFGGFATTWLSFGYQATTSRGHQARRRRSLKMAVADVVIKQEAVDAVDLEERVVELCKANPKGITDQLISQDMPNIPPQQRVTAINRLLSMVGPR